MGWFYPVKFTCRFSGMLQASKLHYLHSTFCQTVMRNLAVLTAQKFKYKPISMAKKADLTSTKPHITPDFAISVLLQSLNLKTRPL